AVGELFARKKLGIDEDGGKRDSSGASCWKRGRWKERRNRARARARARARGRGARRRTRALDEPAFASTSLDDAASGELLVGALRGVLGHPVLGFEHANGRKPTSGGQLSGDDPVDDVGGARRPSEGSNGEADVGCAAHPKTLPSRLCGRKGQRQDCLWDTFWKGYRPFPVAIPMDRLAPTKRPNMEPAGFQSWRNLLFVHWALPPDIVRERVPAPLELDLWEGRAHVGIVPFEMKNIRSRWMPELAALDFLETNVRTYVHYKGEPGVYFFSLEASSWLAVRVARLVWGLPYFHAEMSNGEGTYRSVRKGTGERFEAEWTPGDAITPALGSYEHFVLE